MVNQHRAWLVRLLISLVGRDLAEDVAQDAFVRAYLALGRFHAGGGFRPWLRIIAVRLAYNARRDAQTRARYHDAYRDAPHGSPMSSGDQSIERDALLAALGRIPYPYREILALRYLEELPVRDISKLLNIGVSATKMRLLRARGELKAVYDPESNHE